MNNLNQRTGYHECYADGDTLVTSLPDCVDYTLYQSLSQALNHPKHTAIRILMLDCTLTRQMTNAGFDGLAQLGREAKEQQLRVLLLDPDSRTRSTLAQVLPQAEIIDT